MTRPNFAQLIRIYTLHSLLVGLWVILDRNLCRHSTHCVHAPAVASLDQQLNIRLHKGHGHCNSAPIRQDELRVVPELFNDAEDVIPAPTVETRAVLTELVDYLIHFKHRQDGLNQHSTTDGTSWKANDVLREVEDIIPESCLEVGFHLREVEVRSVAILDEFLPVVEEIETKVEQATRNSFAIDDEMFLLKMPPSRTTLISVSI